MKNRPILLFIPAIERGGVERNVVFWAKILRAEGFRVVLVFARAEASQLQRFDAGVEHLHLKPKNQWRFVHKRLNDALGIGKQFSDYLRKIKAEKPVCISFQSSTISIPICRWHGVPVIARLSNHGANARHEQALLRKLAEAIKPMTHRLASAIVANSGDLAEYYSAVFGCGVYTVFNPVDTNQLSHRSFQGGRVGNNETQVIFAAGRLEKQKDFATLLQAFQIVRADRSCRLKIAGSGSQEASLRNLALELGISDSVEFLGFQEDVVSYMKLSDLFVVSSLYEGFPNVLIEAIAAGSAVVSTNCPTGPREILLDGRGGWLVDVGDPKALAQAMGQALSDPDERQKRWQVALAGLERFAVSAVTKQITAVLEKVGMRK